VVGAIDQTDLDINHREKPAITRTGRVPFMPVFSAVRCTPSGTIPPTILFDETRILYPPHQGSISITTMPVIAPGPTGLSAQFAFAFALPTNWFRE